MAASKVAKYALILYTCAAGTLLIEILQCFISPNNLGSPAVSSVALATQFFTSPDNLGWLEVVSIAFASWFELLAVFGIYIYMTILMLHVSARILFHFRPALREKVKESIRKQVEAQKLKEEAEQKPSTFTLFFYYIFWPLMIVNGSIFLRKQGTPLVQGALQRFVAVAKANFYIYVIELIAFVIVFCLCRACRSRTVEASAAIEEGRPEEASEVEGGIYGTAANYIQASIINEKLVDIDEPVLTVKVVDVDEEAHRLFKAAESTPAELL